MTCPETIIVLKDFAIGIAAATTTIVAVLGLRSWKRELTGKAEFEIARYLLRATYKLRDQIRNCRSSLILSHEFPETYRGPLHNGTNQETTDAYAHVYRNRWAPVSEALQDFDTHTLEAEALWGSNIRQLTNNFRDCVKDLSISIEALLENKLSGGEDFKSDREFAKMIRGKVSAKSSEEDELSQSIFFAITQIENKRRPHLKSS